MAADAEVAAAFEADDAGRVRGHQFDDAGEGQAVFAVEDAQGEAERGFEAGDAVGGALELDLFFWAAWGAWSVAMQSTVPSRRASMTAWRSASARRGGFILALVL